MKFSSNKTTKETRFSFSTHAVANGVRMLAVSALLALVPGVRGQVIYDDFEHGDSSWSSYEGSTGTRHTSFPPDPAGGSYYRIFMSGADSAQGQFTRGGSIRSDTSYSSTFVGVDVATWDQPGMMNLAGNFIGTRFVTPGPLTTQGYIFGYLGGGPGGQQGLALWIEFSGEVTITTPDLYTGGAALTSAPDPSQGYGGYRMVVRTAGDIWMGEMYNRNDLLEPFVRTLMKDDGGNGSGGNAGNHTAGSVGIGNLNLDWTANSDVTYDNFYSTPDDTVPFVGFPGVPQVLNLKPAPGPNSLFYAAPNNGSNLIFTATTLSSTNQVATNTLQLFLNGVDVSSQLVFTEVGSGKTNFTARYTGALAANTIYNGKIIVLNTTAPTRGTTNTWVFDTFQTNGTITVEAEDYNYEAGLFQDNPPVSGLDPNGAIVNGGGFGYFDLIGSPDIDYHDAATDINPIQRNQYRTQDYPGTVQERLFLQNTVRPKYFTAGIGEYVVYYLQVGDWMNYTRTFPATNYNVYLNVSAQKAQTLRFDEVTGDRSQSNQTVVARGEFVVPNTLGSSRFRYVPLTDGAGNLRTLSLSGVKTFRLTDLESSTVNALGVSDIQLNYFIFVPAPAPSSPLRPYVAFANAGSGSSQQFDPEGTLQLTIQNRDTAVSTGTIQLSFDGANVTASSTVAAVADGATIGYKPGFILPKSVHTVKVVYGDGSVTQTNTWSFTVKDMPLLTPALAEAGGPDSAFTIQMAKGQNADPAYTVVDSFPDTIGRIERHLLGTLHNPDDNSIWVNEAAGTNNGFYVETNAINYDQLDGGAAGYFQAPTYPDKTFPGIGVDDPGYNAGDPNHISMAATIKLYLTPGVYRMGGHCDDQWALSAGPQATNALVANSGNVFLFNSVVQGARTDDANGKAQFEFAVQSAGVYKFRFVYEESAGDAYAEWYYVSRTDHNQRTGLVMPVAAPSVSLYSSATVNGTYANDATAVIDTVAKSVTVPKSGNARFYRLNAASALRITSITASGSNIILKYQ